jgi:hypothetical protein
MKAIFSIIGLAILAQFSMVHALVADDSLVSGRVAVRVIMRLDPDAGEDAQQRMKLRLQPVFDRLSKKMNALLSPYFENSNRYFRINSAFPHGTKAKTRYRAVIPTDKVSWTLSRIRSIHQLPALQTPQGTIRFRVEERHESVPFDP